MNQIEIFKASKLYSDMLDSFSNDDKLSVNLSSMDISKAIFFHTCKIKYAGWRHRINFKRKRKHTISEFFQDIIAFYLKASLPVKYEVEVETKIGKTQTDIAIKKDGLYHFLIEVKTTIGWDRPNMKSSDPYHNINQRVETLAQNFHVPRENIIYIFENHGNVSKIFSDHYWDKKNQVPIKRSTDFPYSIIYPLFNAPDPYYWKHTKGFKNTTSYIELTDEDIMKMAEKNIVTPFEVILKKIIANDN